MFPRYDKISSWLGRRVYAYLRVLSALQADTTTNLDGVEEESPAACLEICWADGSTAHGGRRHSYKVSVAGLQIVVSGQQLWSSLNKLRRP
jgi:hypothetical protein